MMDTAESIRQYGVLVPDIVRPDAGGGKVTLTSETLRKYFPKNYTPQRMQESIIKLLEQWQRKRQQQQVR